MPEMDQGIKWLIEHRPEDMLTLALPGAEYLGTLTTDLAIPPQRIADAFLRIRYQGAECALHLEAEAYPNEEIAARCLEYGARGFIATRLPVISVVLWLQPHGAPPTSPYELRAGGWLIAQWYFKGIELYSLPAEQLLDMGAVGVLPLVPFMRGGADLALIERAATLMREQAPTEMVGDLEALLAVFGARTFGVETMRTLLGRLAMNRELLESSPLYQEWKREWIQEGLAEGLAEGEAKGKAEGKAEGKVEGKVEGKAEAALTVLRARFGSLSPAIEEAIRRAAPDTLNEVLAHILDETLEQLTARLGI